MHNSEPFFCLYAFPCRPFRTMPLSQSRGIGSSPPLPRVRFLAGNPGGEEFQARNLSFSEGGAGTRVGKNSRREISPWEGGGAGTQVGKNSRPKFSPFQRGVREPRWGRIPGQKSLLCRGGCGNPGGEEFQARNLTLGGGGCGNPGGEEFQGTYNISCGRPPPAGNRDKTSWFPGFFCRASTKAGVAQHLANPVVYQWFWVFPRKVYLTRGSFGNVADPLLKPARD